VSRTQSTPVAPGQKLVRLERTLLVIGVLALGFNLRTAITSLPPIFPELQTSLGLSSATISILAAAPVICFGVVSGFAAILARRAGEERVLLGAIIALTIGLIARAVAPGTLLFPGTILASGAIAVMNVLLSSLVKRRWPERAGFMIGMYITALSAGAIVGSLVSVPLWQDSGGSVALTLGWLAAPAAIAVLLWLPQLSPGGRPRWTNQEPRAVPEEGTGEELLVVPEGDRAAALPVVPEEDDASSQAGRSSRKAAASPTLPRVAVHRHALTWYVTLFMGMQSLVYYATLSWLPTMLRDRGVSAAGAGDLLALMGVGNLAVSLLVPMAAQRMRSQVTLVVPTVIAIVGGLAALLYAPLGGAVAWALILGAGQNAALALAIYFTAARAPHAVAAASLSSFAQAVGYLLASAGPLEVGLLHSATGSWTAPVMVLFALSAVMLVAGILAARPRMLPFVTAAKAEVAEAEGSV
jgi:MFS transporter, CP family, cyanate transporter